MRYQNGKPVFLGDVYASVQSELAGAAQGPVVYRAAGPGTSCGGTSYDPTTNVTTAWGPCPPVQQSPAVELAARTISAQHAEVAKTQQSLALAYKGAQARNSPATEGLRQQYSDLRGANIAAGHLVVDAMGVDADLRTRLAYTGGRIVAGEPALTAFSQSLAASPDRQRGFAIGVKVARAIGGLDPQYQAMARTGMVGEIAAGFDLGVAKGSVGTQTQKVGAPASTDSGVPSAVYIGAGVVGVLAIAAAVYKFTR